jgi:hypothetical protein
MQYPKTYCVQHFANLHKKFTSFSKPYHSYPHPKPLHYVIFARHPSKFRIVCESPNVIWCVEIQPLL